MSSNGSRPILRGGIPVARLRKPLGDAPRWTRRDYDAVARCVREARASLGPQCDDKTANEITWELTRMFKVDNPRFEELKFIAACTESV